MLKLVTMSPQHRVASTVPSHGSSPELLIAAADKALYQAQKPGTRSDSDRLE